MFLQSYILCYTRGPDVGGPDVRLYFQNWTSGPPLLQCYILCNTGGPDVGGPDVGGPDVPHSSPVTMLRYYFHYLPLLLPPQCFQMDLCVSFQYFLSMSSNVSPVPYLLPKYLLVFFHGSLSNVFSYLLQMFFL